MDSRTPPLENRHAPGLSTGHGQSPNPCHGQTPQGGKVLDVGRAFVRTVRHFWPEFNDWLDELPDTRFEVMVVYHRRFLLWWGLLLFSLKLGSRRQLDFQLRDLELQVLENVNCLAATEQDSLPVNKTLSHFLSHVGSPAIADLRTRGVRRLIRNKVLDAGRLLGSFVVAIDGTGYLFFDQRHCPHCLEHKNGSATYYLHPVLEAKLVDPRGLALSIGTEFIENPVPCHDSKSSDPATLTEYEKVKQDCELKAFARLAPQLKRDFPQLRLCISGDSLYACGPALKICQKNQWSFVLTFKPGRTPTLWEDFQGLLKLSPQNRLNCTLPDKTRQCFRWVNDLKYQDSDGRVHTVNALLCEETAPDQTRTTFSWITDFSLTASNVRTIAAQGGRIRCNIENQGFNIQKNSGLNLEHAYSTDPDVLKAFYYLLQIAHLFLQMFEMGSLLQQLARKYNATPVQLFGSLKNMAQRLLDCFRYFRLGADAFDPLQARACQIRLCDST